MAKDKLPADSQCLSRVHAAALIDVDPQTIDKLIKTNKLRAFRVGRKVLIRKDELWRVVEAGEIQ